LSEEDEPSYHRAFHSNGLLVMGLLGGITFAALVLVLQAHGAFQPRTIPVSAGHEIFDALIFALSLTSILCVVGSLAMVLVLSGVVATRGKLSHFAFLCLTIGALAFMTSLPLLLINFSPIVTIAVGGVMVIVNILLVTFWYLDGRAKKRLAKHPVVASHTEDKDSSDRSQKDERVGRR
jgi:hypothetical protein